MQMQFSLKLYIFSRDRDAQIQYGEQYVEMRTIVVSLSVSPAACNHLHWHRAEEQMLARVVIIRPLFCISENKQPFGFLWCLCLCFGRLPVALDKAAQSSSKEKKRKPPKKKKKQPSASSLMCLNRVYNITSHINIAFTYWEWCLGSWN